MEDDIKLEPEKTEETVIDTSEVFITPEVPTTPEVPITPKVELISLVDYILRTDLNIGLIASFKAEVKNDLITPRSVIKWCEDFSTQSNRIYK